MRFTWGTGLLLFILIFISLCVAFMIFAFNQNINLVQKEYYEKGVDFDKEKAVTERSMMYKDIINIKTESDAILISLPDSFINKVSEAEIFFYRPSDENLDQKLKLNSDTTILKKENFVSGRYIAKISWIMKDEKYFLEKEFSVK